LFREVNERIRDITATLGPVDGLYEFFCECGCLQRVEVPETVYDEVRRHEGQHLFARGHEQPGTLE
jgi:hypothetical protein